MLVDSATQMKITLKSLQWCHKWQFITDGHCKIQVAGQWRRKYWFSSLHLSSSREQAQNRHCTSWFTAEDLITLGWCTFLAPSGPASSKLNLTMRKSLQYRISSLGLNLSFWLEPRTFFFPLASLTETNKQQQQTRSKLWINRKGFSWYWVITLFTDSESIGYHCGRFSHYIRNADRKR